MERMVKAFVIIGISALLEFSLACSRSGDDESTETSVDSENVVDVEEAVPDKPNDGPGDTDEPEPDDERFLLFSSEGDVDAPREYRSVRILESGLPEEVNDEILVEYKTIRVYNSKTNEVGEMIDLIIEFVEPESSPYIGKVLLTDITVYKCYSAGNELFYEGPIDPGIADTAAGNHTLTYGIEFDESYYGTATILVLDMSYDLEEYGTGEIRAKLDIEA